MIVEVVVLVRRTVQGIGGSQGSRGVRQRFAVISQQHIAVVAIMSTLVHHVVAYPPRKTRGCQ
eukprot:scaffold8602_cov196-Amphora_coffeaeformis.AAC.23